jgi:cytochrome P450
MNPQPTSAPNPPDLSVPKDDSFRSRLVRGRRLPELLARTGAYLGGVWGGPFRIGKNLIATRHEDVSEILARDLDFLIAPINAARINAVNGPFVLGMDRDPTLATERNALYAAISRVNKNELQNRCADEVNRRVTNAGATIDVVNGYARPIAAQTAKALFGLAEPDEHMFMQVARAIFAHTFLNIGNDSKVEERALAAAGLMRTWFEDEISRRRSSGKLGDDMMGALLTHGVLDDEGVRRTLGGMLVGSIDTTASAVAKIVKTLGNDRPLLDRVAADSRNVARLNGWCLEILRRWPHNPILLRTAARDTELGGVSISAGATVVAWTQAAMLDPSAFPEPSRLAPDRAHRSYLHFGAGLHPCAGRSINEFQIPLLVGGLLRRGIVKVGSIDWAGPFPDRLDVAFAGSVA